MAQTLSEIKLLLAAYGLSPKKRFGQNFLHDGNHMSRILEAASWGEGDSGATLEVGAGTGALTERLLEAGAHLVAVEVDTDLEPLLRSRFADALEAGRLRLILGDVLAGKHELNPAVIDAVSEAAGPPQAFRLVANLPYNVASPLIINLLMLWPARRMETAVVMVQKEVADRLLAPPGSKAYGPLGILVQVMCETERVATLPPSCFWPAPKVDSSVIRLRLRESPLAPGPAEFSRFVHHLFHQRRKQLRGILREHDVDWPADIEPTARPDGLTLEQLIRLHGVTRDAGA